MATSRNGILHLYTPRLTAFEHIPHPSTPPAQNILIFIGGLFDSLLTVPYPSSISDALPSTWNLVQVTLASSSIGWGTSSLQRDVKELSQCVAYFRKIKTGKVVLMGHSTGCQDVMEYLTGKGHQNRSPIDGGVIQAPASDREAMLMNDNDGTYEKGCETAQKMIDAGEGNAIMPSKLTGFGNCPVTAKRYLSLASPNHDGDDDYFSSDLSDEKLMKSFGALPARSPLLILFSGKDEYVPKHTDVPALVKRWIAITKKGKGVVDEDNSGILEGASHNLSESPDACVNDLVKRVLAFLGGLQMQSNL